MAYEAFRDVLSKIADNYGRAGDKERDRNEKLQDIEAAREFSREQAQTEQTNTLARIQKTSDLETAALLERAQKLPVIQQRALAMSIGVNPDDFAGNPKGLSDAINARLTDQEVRKSVELEIGKLEGKADPRTITAENKVRDAEAGQNQDAARSLYDQYRDLQTKIQNVAAANGVNGPLTAEDLATEKINAWVEAHKDASPSQLKAAFAGMLDVPPPAGKTTDQILAEIKSNPTQYAQALHLISDADIKATNAHILMAQRGQNTADAALLGGYVHQLGQLGSDLAKLRVNPTLPWESQPVYGRGSSFWKEPAAPTAAPAPVPAPPVTTEVGAPDWWKSFTLPGPIGFSSSPTPAPAAPPAPAPAAPAPQAPASSIQGLAQRYGSMTVDPGAMMDVATGGVRPVLNNVGRYGSAALQGLWNGDYSVPQTGILERPTFHNADTPPPSADFDQQQVQAIDNEIQGLIPSAGQPDAARRLAYLKNLRNSFSQTPTSSYWH